LFQFVHNEQSEMSLAADPELRTALADAAREVAAVRAAAEIIALRETTAKELSVFLTLSSLAPKRLKLSTGLSSASPKVRRRETAMRRSAEVSKPKSFPPPSSHR
jgi:hypothetical protein